MEYTHIAAPDAQAIESFYEEHFNPYLNFHRPSRVPEQVVKAKGKTGAYEDIFGSCQGRLPFSS